MKISTDEIDEAIRQLENAFTDGRLDDRELEDRIDQALKAKTEHDLAISLLDLNRREQAIVTTYAQKELYRLKDSRAIFGDFDKTGYFILPKEYRISEVFGSCLLDLSCAQFESPDTTIHISAVYGSVQIIVPRGIRVQIDGTSIMGEIIKNIDEEGLLLDTSLIQIHAEAVFGGITVETKS